MKLTQRMLDLLNKQVNAELEASYLYLMFEAWFLENKWEGFAKYFKKNSEEELSHANKFKDYIVSRNGKVEFEDVKKTNWNWNDLQTIFGLFLKQEQAVSDMIYMLKEVAMEEADYATGSFLKWFLDEQVDSEAEAMDIIIQLDRIGNDQSALMLLDERLGGD